MLAMLNPAGVPRQADNIRWLPAKNANSSTIPPFSAVRITGTTTVGDDTVFTIDQPNVDNAHMDCGKGMAFTGAQAINGSGTDFPYGVVTMLFPLYVSYVSTAPTAGDFIGIQNGAWTLTKSNIGFRCIGDITTANTTCLIMPGPPVYKGKTSGTNTKASTGSVVIYNGTGAGSSTSATVTAYNRFATIADSKYVELAWNGNELDLISGEC